MCRSIKRLHNLGPPATDEEIYEAARQYVRKVSGSLKPSQANEKAFGEAIEAVTKATRELLERLMTSSPPVTREALRESQLRRTGKRLR